MLIPLFLSSWGTVRYGEWLILSSLAAFLSFGDLGAQSYFVNRLTNEWATGSRAAFQETLSTGMAFFTTLSLSIMLVAAIAFVYLPVEIWFGIKTVNQIQAFWVLVLSVAQLAVSIPLGLLLGVYRALGKLATGVMFSNLIMLMQLLVTAIVLRAGAGLAEMAAYQLVSVLTCALIVIWNVHYRFQGTPIVSLRAVRFKVLKEGVHPSAHFFAAQLSQLMTVQGAVVVIGKLLGPVEVVLFTTTRTLMNSVRQISGILHNMSWPEFTRLHAVGNIRLFIRLYLVVFSSSMLIVVVFCALVSYFSDDISAFWLNGKVHLDRSVVSMMGTAAILSNVWMANMVLLMSINEHAVLARIQVISGVIGLVLLAAGAYIWGLVGAIGGLIVGEGLPMVAASYFQIAQHSWLKEQKRNISILMVVVTCAAFLFLVSTMLTITGIVVLLLCIYYVLVTANTLEPNENQV
jgi:O-antigen/teichoic acid export membrane protein